MDEDRLKMYTIKYKHRYTLDSSWEYDEITDVAGWDERDAVETARRILSAVANLVILSVSFTGYHR